jgi:hypothetical protein
MLDYDFVENLATHLFENDSVLKIKKKKSYSQNTERSIYYGTPVIILSAETKQCFFFIIAVNIYCYYFE